MEFRCPSRLHGVTHDDELEVKCSSKRCGAGKGILVFHYFDPSTGTLTRTLRYKDPVVRTAKETNHGTH